MKKITVILQSVIVRGFHCVCYFNIAELAKPEQLFPQQQQQNNKQLLLQ
jgi:hypothetical protein